jgi:hypothetical protein
VLGGRDCRLGDPGRGRPVLSEEEKRQIRQDFASLVNMPPGKLERWLATPASQASGQGTRKGSAEGHGGGDGDGDDEDVGHRAGRRIVELKRTRMDRLVEADYEQMAEIVRYLEQRLARRPTGDVRDSEWRRSLMSWGHDPLA